MQEAIDLQKEGYKEITLLGQNVDSYLWFGGGPKKEFKKLTQEEQDSSVSFAKLLEMVAIAAPKMRIRFSTSHPKDICDEVMFTMKKYDNICKYIHLPAQSGNSRVLELMNRTYTREWYLGKVKRIREIMPDCSISCDIICGFCTETESDHEDTISLMKESNFDFSYMYFYSERPGTLAAKKFEDDVPLVEKKRRLTAVIKVQNNIAYEKNKFYLGKIVTVLIEGNSKKSKDEYKGRNDQNITTVFPKEDYKMGDLVNVLIESNTTSTLVGKAIGLAN